MTRSKVHRQRGAAMVEFVIVLPLLAMLLFGAIEFGRYAYYCILASNAARAGLQYALATSNATISQVETAANSDLGTAAQTALGTTTPTTANYEQLCFDGSTYSAPGSTGCLSGQTAETFWTIEVQGTLSPLFSFPFVPASFSVDQKITAPVS
jgi:Flp pilus assembly protein TadG